MKTKSAVFVMLAISLSLTTPPAFAWIQLSDGGVWEIDYEINDDVWVDWESPGVGTTVEVVDGGHISVGYHLKGFEDSIIMTSGGVVTHLDGYGRSQVGVAAGRVSWLNAYEMSQLTVSGGTIDRASAKDSSRVTVLGGTFGGLSVYDNSRLNMSGGSIYGITVNNSSQVDIAGGWAHSLNVRGTSHGTVCEGYIERITAQDGSHLEISGGVVGYVTTYGKCKVTITGGIMPSRFFLQDKSEAAISGGVLTGDLRLTDYAVLTLDGLDFAVDATPVGYTEIRSLLGDSSSGEPERHLTGTLLSGEPIDSLFRIGDSARIVLVPEPATLLLLGLGSIAFLRRCSE